MTRLALAVVVIAACSSEPTSRAEIAGMWRSAQAGSKPIELRVDGTLDLPVTTDQRCYDAAAAIIDACRTRHHWDRRGSKVRVWLAFVAWSGQPGTLLGVYAEPPPPPGTPPCVCKVDREPTVFELRDANTLVSGDEVVVRVR